MEPSLKTGALIAAAVASLALSGIASAAEPSSTTATANAVKCTGTNSCKGTSDCKTADNACKGQNSCKGKGFVKMAKEDCEKKGGKVAEAK